jgi:hypothetical protein
VAIQPGALRKRRTLGERTKSHLVMLVYDIIS